MTYFWTFVV